MLSRPKSEVLGFGGLKKSKGWLYWKGTLLNSCPSVSVWLWWQHINYFSRFSGSQSFKNFNVYFGRGEIQTKQHSPLPRQKGKDTLQVAATAEVYTRYTRQRRSTAQWNQRKLHGENSQWGHITSWVDMSLLDCSRDMKGGSEVFSYEQRHRVRRELRYVLRASSSENVGSLDDNNR